MDPMGTDSIASLWASLPDMLIDTLKQKQFVSQVYTSKKLTNSNTCGPSKKGTKSIVVIYAKLREGMYKVWIGFKRLLHIYIYK